MSETLIFKSYFQIRMAPGRLQNDTQSYGILSNETQELPANTRNTAFPSLDFLGTGQEKDMLLPQEIMRRKCDIPDKGCAFQRQAWIS